MAHHTTYGKVKIDELFQVDWGLNMVHVPSDESNVEETDVQVKATWSLFFYTKI